MSLLFQSICSSSSGNCVTLRSDTTQLIVDCGLSSMKRTRKLLSSLNPKLPVTAVLVSHIHSDHISYYPLRILEEYDLPLYVHNDNILPLKENHFKEYGFRRLDIRPFDNTPFEIGDFLIRPFEIIHNPRYPTFGFDIRCLNKKIVIATDICQWHNLIEHFINADLIFVESNHDLVLLRKYFNPNSRYHLSNPQTANLLTAVISGSQKLPQAVILGHLSSQRNTSKLALRETTQAFEKAGLSLNFPLSAAPLEEPGPLVSI